MFRRNAHSTPQIPPTGKRYFRLVWNTHMVGYKVIGDSTIHRTRKTLPSSRKELHKTGPQQNKFVFINGISPYLLGLIRFRGTWLTYTLSLLSKTISVCYGLTDRSSIPKRATIFVFETYWRAAKPPDSDRMWADKFLPRVKLTGHDGDHSLPGTMSRNAWRLPQSPHCAYERCP